MPKYLKYYIMRGHNVNIYFSEETYNKIKSLIKQRKVSQFVNRAVEKELEKGQQKEREQLRQQLIKSYQAVAKSQKRQTEDERWDEVTNDGLN